MSEADFSIDSTDLTFTITSTYVALRQIKIFYQVYFSISLVNKASALNFAKLHAYYFILYNDVHLFKATEPLEVKWYRDEAEFSWLCGIKGLTLDMKRSWL